jgi:Cof subfamily protein (haloacid dehalogenase superfamily)
VERRIKMIGLDLDGTLLNEKKKLTSYTRHVLRKAIDRGIIVLAATGRPYTGIPEELKRFPGIRYALTSNGARVIDKKEDKVLIEKLLPIKRATKALETFRKYDTLQEIYFDGKGYADEDKLNNIKHYHKDPNMWRYVLTSRRGVPDIIELAVQKNKDADKIQAVFANAGEQEAAWNELEVQEGIHLVSSLGYNIEINAAGVNKGLSLVELGKILGVEREEIMACGDRDNDIEMLQEAGLGVAMGNAQEEVKAVADYITLTNDENGVAKAIELFALKGGKLC